jgi:hypothetical protein
LLKDYCAFSPQLLQAIQIVGRRVVSRRGKLDRFLQGVLCLAEPAQLRQSPAIVIERRVIVGGIRDGPFQPRAGFRLVAFYVGQMPPAEARQARGFHEQHKGENVWLVVPNDEGVFDGTAGRDLTSFRD